MTSALQELIAASSNLTVSERAELARILLQSLNEEEEQDVQAEWTELAEKRLDEIRSGSVKGIPADEVIGGMRKTQRR